MLVPPLHTSPPQNYLLLPEKRDVIGRKFRTFAENCSFFFSGCENANKAKILCDIPASIAFVIPQRQLVRGKPPNTPFERMEVFMEGLFFAIGFLLGGVVGVLIMCLLQINRLRGKEDSEE